MKESIEQLALYQDILYAQNTYTASIVLQTVDAAGKDGTIKYVIPGVTPQGFQVFSVKAYPSEELDRGYLWRSLKALSKRGNLGIFKCFYYVEASILRVHQEDSRSAIITSRS